MPTESAPVPVKVDAEEVQRAIELMVEPGTVAEMRCIHTPRSGTVSGYFDDPERFQFEACKWSGVAETVYVTLNPVRKCLIARACNRVREWSKHTTKDADVERRNWFLVDLDPVRPAGISSNDEEHGAALDRARLCRDWLLSRGWTEPIFADSGNGAHLLYRISLPNTEQTEQILKRCLAVMAAQFDDDKVKVDTATFNASRVSKLYGTLAAKGDNVPELGRIHRIARVVDVPDRIKVMRLDGGTA